MLEGAGAAVVGAVVGECEGVGGKVGMGARVMQGDTQGLSLEEAVGEGQGVREAEADREGLFVDDALRVGDGEGGGVREAEGEAEGDATL